MKNVMALVLSIMLSLSVATAYAEPLQARLGSESFKLQVVDDPSSRRQGLMGREFLEPNEGMLFDFPADTTPAIWMRNMVISLDLLFVDEQGELVQVFAEVPPCTTAPCEVYRAERPLRFVIEVSAGTAARLGLTPGMELDLGGITQRSAPSL